MKNLILKEGVVLKLNNSNAWTNAVGLKVNSTYTVEYDLNNRLVLTGPLGQLVLVNESNDLTDVVDLFTITRQGFILPKGQ